jgi:hypothetical protein
MTSRTKFTLLLLAPMAFFACGNYSNEDLDFELALPQDGELDAKLPQALTLDNSAEYYKLTRNVVTTFNGIASALTGLVDHVRSYPPTSRNGAERTWGPFADNKHPGWQVRVVMERIADPNAPAPAFQIAYSIQLHNTAPGGTDVPNFMSGGYSSSGGARQGAGNMHLDVQTARAAGYPVADFGDLDHLDLTYHTLSHPITVGMVIVNVATADSPGATYDYSENADGSGELDFDWMVASAPGAAGPTDVKFISRWLGSGAGRADAFLPALTGNTAVGTDCWGPDTVADYVLRWDGKGDLGSSDLCGFGAPVLTQ